MAASRTSSSLLLLAAAAALAASGMPAAVFEQPPAGCPWSLAPVTVGDAATGGTSVTFTANSSFILGTGLYFIPNTTSLNPGDRLCITGKGKAATFLQIEPTLVLIGGDAGLYLQDLTLQGTPSGGGIHSITTFSTPSIPNLLTAVRVDLTNCPGTALYNDNALTAAFHDCSFLDNVMGPAPISRNGGAWYLYLHPTDDNATISISLTGTTVFKGNVALESGGAISILNQGPASCSIIITSTGDVTFQQNELLGDTAQYPQYVTSGGAIMLAGGKVSVNFGGPASTVRFIENKARGSNAMAYGGALALISECDCDDISVTFACKAVEFTGNLASSVIRSSGGAISMTNNAAFGSGGRAVLSFQAPSSFTGNRAGTYASGIQMNQGGSLSPGTIVFAAPACFTQNYVDTQPTWTDDFVLWVNGGSVQVAAAAALSFNNNRGPNQTWPVVDVFIASPGQVFCGASGTNKSAGAYSVQGNLCSAATCGAAQATNCTCATGGAIFDAGVCGCVPPCNTKPALAIPGANSWPDSCAGSNLAGFKCSTTCIPGLEGTPAAVCTFSGQWAPAGGCTPTPCIGLPPVTPPDSSWTGTPCALPGYRTESNSSCTAQCLPGFTGAPAVLCSGGSWVTAPLAGTPCSPNSCPATPGQTPPNASWPAAGCNTTSGAVCQATCAAGFAGQPSSTCSAGAWGPIQGPACVSCGASLAAPAPPPAAVCAGTTSLAASFTLTSASVTATTFTATIDGEACVLPPGSLQQAYPSGVQVPVTCTAPAATGGFAAGQHTISLAAAYVGSAPCPSGSAPAVSTTVVVNPPPAVSVSGAAVTQPTCIGSSMLVSFNYSVAGGTPGASPMLLSAIVSSSYGQQHAATCKTTTKGDSSQGIIIVECPGSSFQAVGQAAQISLQLSAAQGSCTAGQGTATESVPIVCCAGSGSSSGGGAGITSYAAGLPGAQCLAPAPYFTGPTAPGTAAQLVTAISSRCNNTPASKVVGAVATECVPGARIMVFKMTLGAGSIVSKLSYRLSCTSPENWMDIPTPLSLTSTQQRFKLNVTTTPAGSGGSMQVTWMVSREGVAFKFCSCQSWLWSLSVAGSFTDVHPSYCTSSVSTASLKRAARRRAAARNP